MFKPGKIYNLGKDSDKSDTEYHQENELEELDLSITIIKPSHIEQKIDLKNFTKLGKGGFVLLSKLLGVTQMLQ